MSPHRLLEEMKRAAATTSSASAAERRMQASPDAPIEGAPRASLAIADYGSGDVRADASVLEREVSEARSWAARLEAEFAVHLRERDAERAGCAQVFRDLTTEVRKLRRQVGLVTAESVELARRLTLLTSHLGIERRERRRAVQFIAAQGLLDLYAVADEAPEVELTLAASGTSRVRRDDIADAFAPTQRPETLGASNLSAPDRGVSVKPHSADDDVAAGASRSKDAAR